MLVIRHTPDLPLLPPLLAVLVLLNASSAATGVLLGNGTISRDTTPPAAACASLRAVPPPGCVPREGLAANARLLPLLIVGTPRSGVEATGAALSRLSLPIINSSNWVHSQTSVVGAAGWPYVFADESYPMPYAALRDVRFSNVVLQVRHPLDDITAMAAEFTAAERSAINTFAHSHVPSITGFRNNSTYLEQLKGALAIWVEWNTHALSIADHLVRLEALDLVSFCKLVPGANCPSPAVARAAAAAIHSQMRDDYVSTNQVTWEVLHDLDYDLAARAKKLACRLHYDCSVIVRTENIIGAATRFFPFVVGACTRMKNEGPYVREWVEFHRIVGVKRFIVFYDESDDDTLDRLQSIAEQGDVRVYPITSLPGHAPGQQPFPHAEHSFRDACLERNPDRVQWMIFIDGDEFVYPLSQFSLAGHLRQNCNSSVSHLAVQSRMYGSSGMADKVAGELTLETYRRYSNYVSNNAGERRMVHKIIGNTDCVRNMATHYPTRIAPLKSGQSCHILYNVGDALTEARDEIIGSQWGLAEHSRCAKKLVLNHYVTKSRREFLAKYRKGKLSQASKEQELDVDRVAFVGAFGASFIQSGVTGMKQKFQQLFGKAPSEMRSNPMAVALNRFKREFAFKDGDELIGAEVLKYAAMLRQRLGPVEVNRIGVGASSVAPEIEEV